MRWTTIFFKSMSLKWTYFQIALLLSECRVEWDRVIMHSAKSSSREVKSETAEKDPKMFNRIQK